MQYLQLDPETKSVIHRRVTDVQLEQKLKDKKNAEKDVGFVRQFNELKKKHPDAVLLFRKGDFYEMYKEDALKASVILALKVSDKILPLEKDPIKLLTFPRHELDKHLPKLIRSGQRVAICEAIDRPELMKKPREKTGEDLKETNTSNKNTMAKKKKKEQAVQEEPTKTVKTAAEEKPAKEKKTEAKAEVKSEQQAEQKAEAKQERKPREPQMITANGEKSATAMPSKAPPIRQTGTLPPRWTACS